jgi:hypothetical protein
MRFETQFKLGGMATLRGVCLFVCLFVSKQTAPPGRLKC